MALESFTINNKYLGEIIPFKWLVNVYYGTFNFPTQLIDLLKMCLLNSIWNYIYGKEGDYLRWIKGIYMPKSIYNIHALPISFNAHSFIVHALLNNIY